MADALELDIFPSFFSVDAGGCLGEQDAEAEVTLVPTALQEEDTAAGEPGACETGHGGSSAEDESSKTVPGCGPLSSSLQADKPEIRPEVGSSTARSDDEATECVCKKMRTTRGERETIKQSSGTAAFAAPHACRSADGSIGPAVRGGEELSKATV